MHPYLKNSFFYLLFLPFLFCGFAQAEEKTPFAVGSKTVFIHDTTRGIDSLGGLTQGVRVIPTEVWYPVDWEDILTSTPKAKVSSYFFGSVNGFNSYISQTCGFETSPELYTPATTLPIYYEELWKAFAKERKSYLNAPLSLKGHFPLVVCTPGLDNRLSVQTVAESLASHGYVVLACDHPGISPMSQLGFDPSPPKSNENQLKLDIVGNYPCSTRFSETLTEFLTGENGTQGVKFINCLEQIRLDISAILNHFSKLNNEVGNIFYDRLDVTKVGIVGNSLGCIPARAALATIKELKAGVFFTPISAPSFHNIFEKMGIDYLAQVENNDTWKWLTTHEANLDKKPIFFFCAGEDLNAYSIHTLFHSAELDVLPNVESPAPEIDRCFMNAKGPILVCTLLNTTDHSFSFNNPCALTPAISQKEFTRVFNPIEKFTLLKPSKIEEILSDKPSVFFDIYLRGDIHHRKTLIDPKYKNEGLIMKYRYITTSPKN